MNQPYIALAIHAERLDSDQVWGRFSAALARLENVGWRTTVFVSTFWPRLSGRNIDRRLQDIAARGHEIAQHTHYYSSPGNATLAGYKKETDLSRENVEASLNADYEYLVRRGYRPEGFVAGGWAVSPHAQQWLERNGFRYDCTTRRYNLSYPNPAAAPGDDVRTISLQGRVLALPTTAPLKRGLVGMLLGRSDTIQVGQLGYRLWYAHDYDFASLTGMLAARLLPVSTPGQVATAGHLADLIVRVSNELK